MREGNRRSSVLNLEQIAVIARYGQCKSYKDGDVPWKTGERFDFSKLDKFRTKLVDAVSQLRVGDGLQGATDQGPLIDAKALAKVEQQLTRRGSL